MLPDVKIIEHSVFYDDRGFFFESYNQSKIESVLGFSPKFVQDNFSRSHKGVLRGLHYQTNHVQGKLFTVFSGKVFDVAVDLRKSSPHFGAWMGVELSGDKPTLLWIPEGFAHGFLVLSETADCFYKTTDFYDRTSEECLRWNDADLGIKWPLSSHPKISDKDSKGLFLRDAKTFI